MDWVLYELDADLGIGDRAVTNELIHCSPDVNALEGETGITLQKPNKYITWYVLWEK